MAIATGSGGGGASQGMAELLREKTIKTGVTSGPHQLLHPIKHDNLFQKPSSSSA